MLEHIEISNFKSIKNIKLDLGRVNIFIGENGSGKSNILEAIAFLGADLVDGLNYEFLTSRGLRNTKMLDFYPLNHRKSKEKEITFSYISEKFKETLFRVIVYSVHNDNWAFRDYISHTTSKEIIDPLKKLEFEVNSNFSSNPIAKGYKKIFKSLIKIIEEIDTIEDLNEKEKQLKKIRSFVKDFKNDLIKDFSKIEPLTKFLLYSPENSYLRNFSDEGQILPLGIKGEGLFKEIKRIYEKPNKAQINQIFKELEILDWFDSFEIPKHMFPGEKGFNIKDKYLKETTQFFDQRLANEGFLYLLFYFTLLISEKTPKFFAIDNIDASLNPKLCSELIKRMTKISKTKRKQFLATTHNPFILDGLNLEDDAQRLFVVGRNINGETIVNRIQPKEKLTIPLSEAWMRGYLGGLPNNF